MTKNWTILLLALGLTACSTTTKLPPLDDAYYWPEKTQIIHTTQVTPNTPSTPSTSNAPTIEYLNVQDTTVTVRIRR